MSEGPTTVRSMPFGRPMISGAERAAVLEVLDGPILTHGPRVRAFEASFAEFTGAPHALATCSCTAAMHLAWMGLGLRPGDEVIVPAQTHVATAHAVELAGGRCVFADAEAETGNVDLAAVEAAITPRTRGIAVVHYLGLPLDMERAVALARSRGLWLLEDCALAVGATIDGVHVGRFGDAGCFSFYPVKHLTTAEGGMLITTDDTLARCVAMQRAFGIDRNDPESRDVPGLYDAVLPGNNYRLHEIGAAMGVEQMKRLPGFLAARDANFAALAEGIAALEQAGLAVTTLRHEVPGRRHAHYCYPLILKGPAAKLRSKVMDGLRTRGVGVSIYYPRPVPLMTYYAERNGVVPGRFPVAERLSNESITLPVGPHLGLGDMAAIVSAVEETMREVTGS